MKAHHLKQPWHHLHELHRYNCMFWIISKSFTCQHFLSIPLVDYYKVQNRSLCGSALYFLMNSTRVLQILSADEWFAVCHHHYFAAHKVSYEFGFFFTALTMSLLSAAAAVVTEPVCVSVAQNTTYFISFCYTGYACCLCNGSDGFSLFSLRFSLIVIYLHLIMVYPLKQQHSLHR